MTKVRHFLRRSVLLFVGLLLVSCSSTEELVPGPDLRIWDSSGVEQERQPRAGDVVAWTELLGTDGGADMAIVCTESEAAVGCPCSNDADCLTGYCELHLGNAVCSSSCVEDCPLGWTCEQVPGATDGLLVCLSLHPSLCLPCKSSADCVGKGERCVVYSGQQGAFCGAPCGAVGTCPAGYECMESATTEADTAEQCRLAAGICGCSPYAIALGLATFCERQSDAGTCGGEMFCSDEGLSPCDAPEAVAESCDGVDNDCDGNVDEGNLCDDGNFCTDDVCGDGVCQAEPLSGVACFDADLCTTGEVCEAGECVWAQVDCDDVNPCTDDSCDPDDGCFHVANSEPCEADADPCTEDLCGEGSCTHPPGNDGAACEDQDPCTINDYCVAGDCTPGAGNPECYLGCGDGNCSYLETPEDCPVDCGPCGDGLCGLHEVGPNGGTCPQDCLAACGDGLCEGGENPVYCQLDCGGCGDGFCGLNESPQICSGDCPPACGNGACEEGEGIATCALDCMPPCGDGQCGTGENPFGCPQDCSVCGDSVCAAEETKVNCPSDCATPCGNGVCDGGETPDECAADCGPCGDDICGFQETAESCPNDCLAGCGDGLCDPDVGEGLISCPADCATDADGDGIEDDVDNCPNLANDEQEDYDEDGAGDVCDLDDDNDGEKDATDCDDFDAQVNHEAAEVCDGKDNDCDNNLDEELGTITCGLGECEHSVPACAAGMDNVCDPLEGAADETCDGLDNNCDGESDEGLGETTCGLGNCEHTVPDCLNGQSQQCDPLEGMTDEVCDGADNNCDGEADDGLGETTCGLGNCEHTVPNCLNGNQQQCDPLEGMADEVCDGTDNDCNGSVDDGFLDTDNNGEADCIDEDDDGDGAPDLEDCAPLDPDIHPGAQEICDDADNDCDEVADPEDAVGCDLYYVDSDADGYGEESTGKCLCGPEDQHIQSMGGDCDDANDLVKPGADEQCNGLDDDCDGQGDPPDTPGCQPWYLDSDGDGAGIPPGICLCGPEDDHDSPSSDDCDDSNETAYPGAEEVCDGADNNCDQAVDEGFLDTDGDTTADCVDDDDDGDFVLDEVDNCPLDFNPGQQNLDQDDDGDICDLDDDGDGDPDDSDCAPKNPLNGHGLDEVCDGQDNNCDEAVDEGFPDTDGDWTLDCMDDDDDGDGDPDDTDCEPLNPAVGPSTTEVCDGMDNNCNDSTDEDPAALCSDNNPCTDDLCAGQNGCANPANSAICDDGDDFCSVNDLCSGGVCVGEPPDCSDGLDCTDDGCVDGQGCVQVDICDDDNECTDDQCEAPGCVFTNVPKGTQCGVFPLEECQAGTCVCTPDCAGKECGPDGCGNACGDCPQTNMGCDEGTCYLPQYVWSQSYGAIGAALPWEIAVLPDGRQFVAGNFTNTGLDFGAGGLPWVGNKDIFAAAIDNGGTPVYGVGWGADKEESARSVAADSQGHAYVCGYYKSASLSFGGETFSNQSVKDTYADAFLVRLKPDGSHDWSKSIGSIYDDQCMAVRADSDGNIVVAGKYSGGFVDFGGGNLPNEVNATFVVRYDNNGNHVLSRSIAGSGATLALAVGMDSQLNIYVAGTTDEIWFDAGGGKRYSHGGVDIFIAKFDASGNHLWSRAIGGIDGEGTNEVNLAVTSSGTVALASYLASDIADLGGGQILVPSSNAKFIASYDPDGILLWHNFVNGTLSRVNGLAFGPDGSIYGTGGNSGFTDLMTLARYDLNGEVDWWLHYDCSTQYRGGNGRSVGVDAVGNVFVVGEFNCPAFDLGGGILPRFATSTNDDLFFLKLSQ